MVNRDIFPSHVTLYVLNDALAVLSSRTMGKLHGRVLIASQSIKERDYTKKQQLYR